MLWISLWASYVHTVQTKPDPSNHAYSVCFNYFALISQSTASHKKKQTKKKHWRHWTTITTNYWTRQQLQIPVLMSTCVFGCTHALSVWIKTEVYFGLKNPHFKLLSSLFWLLRFQLNWFVVFAFPPFTFGLVVFAAILTGCLVVSGLVGMM